MSEAFDTSEKRFTLTSAHPWWVPREGNIAAWQQVVTEKTAIIVLSLFSF